MPNVQFVGCFFIKSYFKKYKTLLNIIEDTYVTLKYVHISTMLQFINGSPILQGNINYDNMISLPPSRPSGHWFFSSRLAGVILSRRQPTFLYQCGGSRQPIHTLKNVNVFKINFVPPDAFKVIITNLVPWQYTCFRAQKWAV